MAKRRNPMDDYQQAIAPLRKGEAQPVAVVSGGQEWFRREAVNLYTQAVEQMHPGVDVIHFQGPASAGETNLPVTAVLEELTSYGLFASNKLVIVRRAQRFLFPARSGDDESGAGAKRSDALLDYIQNPTEGMFLLFELDSLDKRLKLGKTLNKAAQVVPCPELKYERDTLTWLRAQARTQGVEISPQASEMLFVIHGADPGVLAAELQKLSLYVEGTGQIDEHAVQSFMGGTMALSFFELGNAVEAGDRNKALELARRMVRQGIQDRQGKKVDLVGTVHMAMGSLRTTWQSLWQAHDVVSRGGSQQDLAQTLGNRAWRAKDLYAAGRRLTFDDIQQGMAALTNALASLHDTGSDPALTLERTVFQLTTPVHGKRR